MKKILAIILLVALMISIPTGCGKKLSNRYLQYNLAVDPKTWDPGKNSAVDGGHMINALFQGLYQETEDGIMPADVADLKVSEDKKTYTFTLKDGLKWSDGKPVTAKDYEFAWKRVCAPETASEYSFIMAPYLKFGKEYLNSGLVKFDKNSIKALKEAKADLTDKQYDMLVNVPTEDELKAMSDSQISTRNKEIAKIRKAIRNLVGVKAVDDKTLVATLVSPCSYFKTLTSFYSYYPVREDCVGKDGWEKKLETCIGNGPFMLEEYQISNHIKLKKNPNYIEADKVKISGIECSMVNDANTALNAYNAGDFDVNNTIPLDQISKLRKEDPTFHIKTAVSFTYVYFNCDKEPTNDVRVRKALSLAIDRNAMCENVLRRGDVPATGPVPTTLFFSDGSCFRKVDKNGNPVEEFGIDPYDSEKNVKKAQELLADAGYPNGEGFPQITYLYNTNENNKKIAEALQAMWKKNLNIDVKLDNQDWAVFQDARHNGNFEIARGGWNGDYAEPMTMLDLFTSYSGNNDSQWRWNKQPVTAPHDKTLNPGNKEFDKAIQEALIKDGKEKDEAYKKAEQILMDECPIANIYYAVSMYQINDTAVEGVKRSAMGTWIFKDAVIYE